MTTTGQSRETISTRSGDNFSVTITADDNSILNGNNQLDGGVARVCSILQGRYGNLYPPCPEGKEHATEISVRAKLELAGEHVEVEVLFRSRWRLDDEARDLIREQLQPFASLLIGRVLEAINFCMARAELEAITGETCPDSPEQSLVLILEHFLS